MANPDYSPMKTILKGIGHGAVAVLAFLVPLVIAHLDNHPVDIPLGGVVIPTSVTIAVLVALNNYLKNR